MADIEAMFMRIAIIPEDQSCRRFLWPTDQTIRQYQYTRLIFGARCSPATAIFVLQRTAQDFAPRQEIIDLVNKNFYMDDFVHSFQSTEEAHLCVSDLKSTLQKGGFNLTKFVTNEPNALEMLESEHIETETEDHQVLGLLWNSSSDKIFHKKLSKIDQDASHYTLRKLLSLIACLFDPLGIIAPIVITLKIILQDTWKEGLSWDDLLSSSKRQQIQDWIDKYLDSPQIQMPRSFSHLDISSGSNQLHVFCDASQLAYGAVIYIKTLDDKETSSNFVFGRAKIALLKQIGIPKLELQAAVLGCRLWQFVTQHLSVPIKERQSSGVIVLPLWAG